METSDLAKWRAHVIERSINLEWIVSATISQHYFGAVPLSFLNEVLFDEQFHFGLKCNVLAKVLEPSARQLIDNLRRLGNIRNTFAHCGPHLASPAHPEGFAQHPKRLGVPLDFGALFEEFKRLSPRVEQELLSAFRSKGGVASTEPPFPSA